MRGNHSKFIFAAAFPWHWQSPASIITMTTTENHLPDWEGDLVRLWPSCRLGDGIKDVSLIEPSTLLPL